MPDNFKNPETDSDELLDRMIAEEIMKNDDIVQYTEGESLAALKSRYEALESDENILAEDLRPRQKKGIFRKQRPIEYSGYFYEPIAADNPNEVKTPEVSQDFSSQFDTAPSEFDRDKVSFRDIKLDAPAEEHTEPQESAEEEKAADEVEPKPTEKNEQVDESSTSTESESDFTQSYISDDPSLSFEFSVQQSEKKTPGGFSSAVNRVGYNTNTKVVFADEDADKPNTDKTDSEIGSLFSAEGEAAQHSRRFNPFKSFRRKK